MGNRMSSLPIARFCGQSPRLDVGAGRSAAMSTAFHAQAAAKSDEKLIPAARRAMAALSDKERAEISNWHIPTPLNVLGLTLAYATSTVEETVGITEDETFTTDPEKAVTIGHPDMYWTVHTELDGEPVRVVVLGDIKRQKYTLPEPPEESLQLQAYGHALCAEHNADFFLPCVWVAEEGFWIIGQMLSVRGMAAMKRWAVIVAAAKNDSTEFSHGPHCGECWSRTRCPAHMVRYGETLVVPGTLETTLDESGALALLVGLKRHEDMVSTAKEYLKAWVKENGPIPDGNGKVWAPVQMKGRESSASPKKLREELGEEAEKLISKGAPYEQYRWAKPR